MRIGVPKESVEGEKRVALIPDTVKSLVGKELEVVVESGAGADSGHPDEEYSEAGATVGSADDAWDADVVLRVATPSVDEIGRLGKGKVIVGFLAPLTSGETTKALADGGVTSFAIESIPRITRAQAMDGLSSQANVGGYAAALLAARECGRFFPMMTTAAGTVSPARVMVLGAGVAGLQAIATAKRLGAVVTGFDIRRAAWEQISSLGGRPLELDFIPDAEDEGGYARPLTDEENEQVREALAENAGRQDVIITTAQIPGRKAPILLNEQAVENMKPGSVIVDLAGDSGGNCALTEGGRTVTSDNGVKIISPVNLPSDMAAHASQLYAKNLENFIDLITDEGKLALDFSDEVVAGACITHEGEVRNERAAEAAGVGAAAPAAPESEAPSAAETPATASEPATEVQPEAPAEPAAETPASEAPTEIQPTEEDDS